MSQRYTSLSGRDAPLLRQESALYTPLFGSGVALFPSGVSAEFSIRSQRGTFPSGVSATLLRQESARYFYFRSQRYTPSSGVSAAFLSGISAVLFRQE